MTSSYVIVDYDAQWPVFAVAEIALVASTLQVEGWRVEHIGSTSVPGLAAKPIIDLVLGVPEMKAADLFLPGLDAIGYEHRGETVPGTLYNRKAVPRRFNLHLTQYGGGLWTEHVLFRDYLRSHPEVAAEYEGLKRVLMAERGHDPPAYNAGKTDFIQGVLARAVAE
jgi:GrpB-like predicted nucleotidyltransferase (UPF0157 family)